MAKNKFGLSTSLNSVQVSEGTMYVTTDTEKLYIDNGNKRIPLSDIIIVNSMDDMINITNHNKLYYVSSEDILLKFSTVDNDWVVVNGKFFSDIFMPKDYIMDGGTPSTEVSNE